MLAIAVVQLLAMPTKMQGQALEVLRYSPDITAELGAVIVDGGRLASDDLSGGVTVLTLPDLPANTHVSAAHRFANGDLLLAFDSTATFPAAGTVEPRDLVRLTGATQVYSVEVRGANVGISLGAHIDAVAVTGDGTILLSLDISVGELDDEDVIRIDGNSLALFLDVSAVGAAEALDLDGLDVEENGTLLYLSFDGSGTADGAAFDDEDIVAYNLTTQIWTTAYDGSDADAGWPAAADLIALDVQLEPSPTATPTVTPTATATATDTETAAATTTATASATDTATAPGPTNTATATEPGVTATATATAATPAATDTATATATAPGPTGTATVTPATPAPTATATATAPATGTATATTTASPTSPVATATATATGVIGATSTATATATATATTGPPCPGDCDGSGEVTINELILMVNIALGTQPVSACPAGDVDQNGVIAINEIILAVGSALNGCPLVAATG